MLVPLVWGCSKGEDYGFVTGKLTIAGEPAPVGTQIFFKGVGKGAVAAGKLDESGRYELKLKGNKKIVLGEYTVFLGAPPSDFSPAEYAKFTAKVKAEYRAKGKKPPSNPEWVLPEIYYTPQTSPLRATVENGTNDFPFDLEES